LAFVPKSDIGKKMMKGKLLPYKLMDDVVYPMRPWYYSSFKCEKDELPKAKAH
jgi:hypothetical protein